MVQTWFDNDGLYHKYGTLKAVPNKAGEYKTYGALREIEVKVDISTLTTTAAIISDQTFFPKAVFLEEIVVEVQVPMATSTTFNMGLVQSTDRSTAIGSADIGLINAMALAVLTPAGKKITLNTAADTGAGALVGTVPISAAATFTGMLTAKVGGGAGTGVLIVRIRYRTVV